MAESISKGKRKSNLPLLGGVLLVLVAIAVLLADPFGWREKREQSAEQKAKPVLVNLKRDDISALEITPAGGNGMFRLEKKDDRWWLTQGAKKYKANMDRVNSLLDGLGGLSADSLATQDASEYNDMEVSDAKAVLLRVYKSGAEPEVTLHVGKAAPGYQTSFVRKDNGKEVWRAGKNIKSLVGFAFNDYRSRKPWDFDPDKATKISVMKFIAPASSGSSPPPAASKGSAPAAQPGDKQPPQPGPVLDFELKDALWKHNGANANQNSVKELLNKLKDLDVTDFADTATPDVMQLENRPAAITVSTPGDNFSLTLGAKDGSYWYVKDQDGVAYKLTDYNLGFYKDLPFDKLTFDDTKKAEAAPPAAKGGAIPGSVLGKPAAPGAATPPAKPGTPPAAPPAKPAPPAAPPPAKPGGK